MYSQFPDFDGHELVTSREERGAGLAAFIAVHNSNLGPAMGGCRIVPYSTAREAITDVLRLSRGMTYKSAIARIPYGGGKAVIVADPRTQKTPGLLYAMGDFVDSLCGRYITSFDSGTTLDDVRTIAERTNHTAGTMAEAGNASASTAFGIFCCLRVAARVHLGRSNLEGMHVAIQGVGNVGRRLGGLLRSSGARLTIADSDANLATKVAAEIGAQVVGTERIHRIEADIFAPCALGGILREKTIKELGAKAIVGGANNQLATPEDDRRLRAVGVLYCPDFLANAGGIIDLHYQRSGWSRAAVERHVAGLADTFTEVIERSRTTGSATGTIADQIAEQRFRRV